MSVSKYIIYGLTDPRSGLIRYVGKSISGLQRARQHRSSAKSEDTYKARWIKSLRRLGLDFRIEVLEEHLKPNTLSAAEKRWIAYLRTTGVRLTNLTDGGDGQCGRKCSEATRAKFRKRKISEETKEKLRKANLGKKNSPECRAKISAANKGKPSPKRGIKLSKETRRKISEGMKGRVVTQETRKKISQALMGKPSHKNSPETRAKISAALKGHSVSEETRKKISQSKMGHEVSAETRKKLSEKNRLYRHTPEAKEKIRIAQYKRSPETLAKMRASQKRRWKRERENADS